MTYEPHCQKCGTLLSHREFEVCLGCESLASASGSANFDMDAMMEVIRRFNERKPPPGPLAIRSDILRRLNEMPKPKGTIFESVFGGIKVYEKPGQLFPAWMIGDNRILEKYLSGEITEADLIRCVGAAGLLPNDKAKP